MAAGFFKSFNLNVAIKILVVYLGSFTDINNIKINFATIKKIM